MTTANDDIAIEPAELWTITAGGFSATCDAFARDPETDGLWFCSMLGSQTAVKAIWAALLKQPPEAAFLIQGADGATHQGGYLRCQIPAETIGSWTTRIARLPHSGGWHALVYTRLAEFRYERDQFLLLAPTEREAPALYRRFLDRRSPLPLHHQWSDWLWRTALDDQMAAPLESTGLTAYLCRPDHEALRTRLSEAVRSGRLRLEQATSTNTNGVPT